MRRAAQRRLDTFLMFTAVSLAGVAIAAVGVVTHYAGSRRHLVAPAPDAATAQARPVDRVVLGFRDRALGADRLTDVAAGSPYQVDVYQDVGHATATRVDVDLDRDARWDERVTFEPGLVLRRVASEDDERYDLTFRWDGSGWVPEP